jgi:hypothetical protein
MDELVDRLEQGPLTGRLLSAGRGDEAEEGREEHGRGAEHGEVPGRVEFAIGLPAVGPARMNARDRAAKRPGRDSSSCGDIEHGQARIFLPGVADGVIS